MAARVLPQDGYVLCDIKLQIRLDRVNMLVFMEGKGKGMEAGATETFI